MNSVSELRLCDIASTDVLTITVDMPLVEAIALFVDKQVSSLIVLTDEKPVGILTERDLVYLMSRGIAAGGKVGEVMSAPVLTTQFDLDFAAAQLIMTNRGIRHLVLVDDAGTLKGVASETDFRRHLGLDLFDEISNLSALFDQRVELVAPDQPLLAVLQSMSSRWIDCVVVGREGIAEGILTERDVPRLLARRVDPATVTIGEVMTQPLVTVCNDLSVTEAARTMEQTSQRHLVVVDAQGSFVGVLSQHRMLERLGVMLIEDSRRNLANRLGMVLESTGVGTWEYDHRREVFIRSQALNNVMRFSPDDAYEKLDSMLQRVCPDDRVPVGQAFRELLSGSEKGFSIDFRTEGGDGRMRWISSRGQVVQRDEDGAPLRSAGVVIDIDQQKISEIALQQSDDRFRGLIEKIALPVAYINSDREILFINQQFIDTFGYTLGDVLTVDLWNELAYPDPQYRAWARQTWIEAAQKAQASVEVIRPPIRRVVCKDGGVRFIELSGVILGENLLVTLLDMTERHQQQATLEFSNSILHRVSGGTALPDILAFITGEIEVQIPEVRCSVLLLDANGKSLRHGAAPGLPAAYCAAIDGQEIGPAAGSCGTAAFLGQAVFAGDIATSPLWVDFKSLAVQHGLAACWSTPIMSSANKVLGTFAVYWSKPIDSVSPLARRYVDTATTLAGIAIEGTRREQRLRDTAQRLQRAEQISHSGSWALDLETGKVRCSKQMFRLFNQGLGSVMPQTFDAFLELVHPADRTRVNTSMRQMLAGETPETYNFRRDPSLGPPCCLQATFSIILDESGVCLGFDGVVLDVTERLKADERLRQQLDELRRWQAMTLGREARVLELKREVNALLERGGNAPRYQSVVGDGGRDICRERDKNSGKGGAC